VLLASAESLVNYAVNVDTFANKSQRVREFVQEKVFADFRKIYQAIDDYSRKQKKVLTTEEGIKMLVEKKFVKPEDLLDPWGNSYRVQPGGEDFMYVTFLCLVRTKPRVQRMILGSRRT